ncbi:transposase-associated domain-containing protein [Tanacetum coccineum]
MLGCTQELNITSQYVGGVEYFLNFAFEKSSQHGMILCPCADCHNRFHFERAEVYDHLICVCFKRGYLNWTDHREIHEVSSSSMMENDEDEDNDHEMHEILHDLFSDGVNGRKYG